MKIKNEKVRDVAFYTFKFISGFAGGFISVILVYFAIGIK